MDERFVDVVISGYEIRKIANHEKWLKLVHLQDGNLRRYTLSVGVGSDPSSMYQELISRADPGTTVNPERALKRFSSWNTQFDGVGVVRGHSVTYSPHFGVQVWAFLEVDLPGVGTRNIATLTGESKDEIIASTEDLQELWAGSFEYGGELFKFGSVWPIEFNARIKKHELIDRSAPEPTVDPVSSGELSASPAG